MACDRKKNLYQQIAGARFDSAVGIRIAHLAGDDQFSFYGAELEAGAKVGAHYHSAGTEIYQILEGEGLMHTGPVDSKGKAAWKEPFPVMPGDCFNHSGE